MRFLLAVLILRLVAPTAHAQVISVDNYVTKLDVGEVHTELMLYERRGKIFAMFTAKGPFEANAREMNVSKDGCHEVFYSGRHQNEPFTVTLSACSDTPHCELERQILTVKANYMLMFAGEGRQPQIRAKPIVKSIRPGLRSLPC